MRSAWRLHLVAAFAVSLTLSCGEAIVAPESGTQAPGTANMTEEGCRQTPGCWDDEPGPDPYAAKPGYRLDQYVTPQQCFAASIGGLNGLGATLNDIDQDGLDDNCEQSLALAFRPYFRTHPNDCDLGGAPHWAAKYFPARSGSVTKPTVRLFYLSAYYRDCGVPDIQSTVGCETTLGATLCSGHYGDSEFVVVDVRYNATYNHWYVSRAFMTAHYRAGGESSREAFTCLYETCTPYMLSLGNPLAPPESRSLKWADRVGGKPSLFVAHNKHGAYPDLASCNSGGAFGYDSCDGISLTHVGAPLFFSGNRNIGSWEHKSLNCVTLPGDYFHPGQECFWDLDSNHRFLGWLGQWDPRGGAVYGGFILRRFECYALPENQEPGSSGGAYCDRGLAQGFL